MIDISVKTLETMLTAQGCDCGLTHTHNQSPLTPGANDDHAFCITVCACKSDCEEHIHGHRLNNQHLQTGVLSTLLPVIEVLAESVARCDSTALMTQVVTIEHYPAPVRVY